MGMDNRKHRGIFVNSPVTIVSDEAILSTLVGLSMSISIMLFSFISSRGTPLFVISIYLLCGYWYSRIAILQALLQVSFRILPYPAHIISLEKKPDPFFEFVLSGHICHLAFYLLIQRASHFLIFLNNQFTPVPDTHSPCTVYAFGIVPSKSAYSSGWSSVWKPGV